MRSNDICFLGIIRSCKAANIPVISITFDWLGAPEWFSEYSHCLGERYEIANPFTDPQLAVENLLVVLKKLYRKWNSRLMVLPSSDTNLIFLLDHYKQFEPYILMMGSREFTNARTDVIHKVECAKKLEATIPEFVPSTQACKSHNDIKPVVEQMAYPAIYKPAVKDYGQTFYRKHKGFKAVECTTKEELQAGLTSEMDDGYDIVVQEKIHIESPYDEIPFYLYADANGEIRMSANGIKELIHPQPFGTAIILRFAWFPELLDIASQVVKALSYRGILMIEFARDAKDGQWKVIEVNTRHWLFSGFYQRLGLNYTACLYDDLYSELPKAKDLITISPEMQNRNYVHLDLFAISKHISASRENLSLGEYCDKLESIDGSITSAYYDFSDPEPGIKRLEKMSHHYGWNKQEAITKITNQLN